MHKSSTTEVLLSRTASALVDGTLCRIARPQNSQRAVYNGHKRVHGIKFQSVVIPSGLIANLAGPFEGRRHDSTMLHESRMLRELQRVAWANAELFMFVWRPSVSPWNSFASSI